MHQHYSMCSANCLLLTQNLQLWHDCAVPWTHHLTGRACLYASCHVMCQGQGQSIASRTLLVLEAAEAPANLDVVCSAPPPDSTPAALAATWHQALLSKDRVHSSCCRQSVMGQWSDHPDPHEAVLVLQAAQPLQCFMRARMLQTLPHHCPGRAAIQLLEWHAWQCWLMGAASGAWQARPSCAVLALAIGVPASHGIQPKRALQSELLCRRLQDHQSCAICKQHGALQRLLTFVMRRFNSLIRLRVARAFPGTSHG